MLPALITLKTSHQYNFIDCQISKWQIPVLPIIDVTTRRNSTLALCNWAYQLQKFTCQWLPNLTYGDYQPLFTTQVSWTIIKLVMEILKPFQYWTLWISTEHKVTLHHIITICNDMFNYMNCVMLTFNHKKDQLKGDLDFAMKSL